VTEAVIVLVIVVIVQQLDGDILAPFIFGRSVRLNPAIILVALTAGGAAGGIVGAFLAVPVAASVSALFAEVWARRGERWLADAEAHAGVDGEAGETGEDGTASGTVST